MKRVFLPVDNVPEASVIPDIDVIGVAKLSEAVSYLTGDATVSTVSTNHLTSQSAHSYNPDFSHIIGQDHAKRALLIAAAGGHNILMQ